MDLNRTKALQELWNLGIKEEQINDFDIVILPENYDENKENLYDSQDSITISKLFKAEGISCANSFDLNLDLPTKDRKGNDVWIGQMYILNDLVVPLLVGVLQTYLEPLIFQRKNRRDDRAPAADVHVDIKILKGDDETSFSYKGDPEAFIRIMNALKNTEQNNDNTV